MSTTSVDTVQNTRPPVEALFPLDVLHQKAGRPLPDCCTIPPSSIPGPYHHLLVHERDMTRTLEAFHGRKIHLQAIASSEDATGYWREVVLRLDGCNRAVEFGAIMIRLDSFSPEEQAEIRAGQRPLGAILNSGGRPYLSRPSAFLKIFADEFLGNLLGTKTGSVLYGRVNELKRPDGSSIARIVEILPP